jgi:hypothetical protein
MFCCQLVILAVRKASQQQGREFMAELIGVLNRCSCEGVLAADFERVHADRRTNQ